MATQVLDSSDTKGILADAGVELEEIEETKETPEVKEPESNTEDDDIEGEDGLTPRQRREWTGQMQKTIGKKHRMMKEAEEFAAAQYSERKLAEQRAETLERELDNLRKASQPESKPEPLKRPERNDFKGEGEYLEAMIQYGVELKMNEKAENDAREAAQKQAEAIFETAKERIAKAIELVPDFEEVTASVNTEVPAAISNYMIKSDLFAELGYYFAKNPDVLVSLTKLPIDEQLVKLGKIESKLEPFGKNPDNDSQSSHKNGKVPSEEKTEILPGKSRNEAPVITPLNEIGASAHQKESRNMDIRETISDWQKKNRVNLNVRRRH